MKFQLLYHVSEKFKTLSKTASFGRFNLKELENLTSDQQIKLLEKLKFPKIGEGTARVVYAISSKKALKLAKNEKGIAQNRVEKEHLIKFASEFFPKYYDGANDDSWILVELVRPLMSEAEFKSLLGISFEIFSIIVLIIWDLPVSSIDELFTRENIIIYYNDFEEISEKLDMDVDDVIYYLLSNEKFVKLLNFLLQTNLLVSDFAQNISGIPVNFGKNSDGNLVVLDAGFNQEVYEKHYR